MEPRVEPLGPDHDREGFCCDSEPLDNYLKRQARQDIEKRVSTVFVATFDGKIIAGYYSLSQYSVLLEKLPPEIVKKLPRYPQVPATLIGRLAVSRDFRGKRLGELLLMDALNRSLAASKAVAAAVVVVDAKNDDARTFYHKYQFQEFPDNPNKLFLPMKTVESGFAE